MNWGSWDEFLAMGGYGLYVWASVLVVLAVMAGELLELAGRRRSALRALGLALKEHA